jgi:hypothetical protein
MDPNGLMESPGAICSEFPGSRILADFDRHRPTQNAATVALSSFTWRFRNPILSIRVVTRAN